jgi:hypothetical protein
VFLGLRTVIYPAPNLAESKAWYAEPGGSTLGIIENPLFELAPSAAEKTGGAGR